MIKLEQKKSTIIFPTQPYNFNATIFKPSHFPIKTEYYINGKFYFSLNWKNNVYGITLQETGNGGIQVNVFYEHKLFNHIFDELVNEIKYRFDMNSNLNEFVELACDNKILNSIEKKWHGMRPRCAYSLYEFLCITLVLQNTQVSRSIKMMDIMLQIYGKSISFDNVQLSAFWTPNDLVLVTESELRALKVGYRAKTFLKQADFFFKDRNFEYNVRTLDKSVAKIKLLEIYGVGKASVWYLMFENLHYYDAFDYISPWENKILSKVLYDNFDEKSEKILSYAKKHWKEYRMLAIHYIFENIFWMRKEKDIEWLNKLIRM